MKKKYFCRFILAASVVAFWGCGSHEHSEHGHSHEHEHEHSADEHDHDHEAEGEEGEHAHHDGDVEFDEHLAKEAGFVVETVNPAPFSNVIKTSGRIMSAGGDERVVAAPVSGIVRFANPKLTPGCSVGAGQALFSITAQGTADGDAAASAKAQLDNARNIYDRIKKLYDQKLATITELQQAEADLNSARAALSGPAAKAAAGSMSVSSPMGGYLVTLDVRPGEYVTAGQVLGTVASQKRLRVQANLSERHFSEAPNISGANIVVPAGGATLRLADLNGAVTGRGRASDAGHTMPVYLEFDNPGSLVSGSIVEVYLLGAPRAGVLSVPKSAITEEQGLYYLFVQEDETHYHKTPVKLGASDGTRVEIREGLEAGAKVVTSGAQTLKMKSNAGSVPGHTHNH